ncbi:MAG: Gfo/Idh/MocA family oxidoreductase [Planctomycetes bacterium]|nr:Gfo/Idh/MocA family oxidoreductase [Planctomycetota bacterium]
MSITRRSFFVVSGSALALGSCFRRNLRLSPNETLRVAHVGVGGMGSADLAQVASAPNVRIVALCDVDTNRLDVAAAKHEGTKTFRDYRVMLDRMHRDIDAVVVSTPDHMHGPIAISAMELGKHIYCQKPIAHNLRECRRMTELASDRGLVTQMGTQIHAHEAYRTAVATLRTGVLGKVHEAHLWVSKSWSRKDGRPDRNDPVPSYLDWDLWLGVAPYRDYVEGIYHPAQWRGWKDFGCGTLGDMGCHIFDPVFTALGLGAPRSVVSRGPEHFEETFAPDSDITYEFEGTDRTTDTLTFRWTDGASKPDRARAQLPDGVDLPGAGSFLVGEHGVMVIPHWAMPKFYRNGEPWHVELEERGPVNHYHEWTEACRSVGETSTPFSYSGPLTEAVLAGTVAGRFRDRQLHWDSQDATFDYAPATELVHRQYRDGWAI